MKIFYDNKSIMIIANKLVQHDITKHVEIDKHFIKGKLDNDNIYILYIPSNQQIVNVLTKGLLGLNFDSCMSKLSLIEIYAPT